jgi:small subunit ribosomal protein S4
MARYTGPVCRLCRREGEKLFLKGDRCYTTKCAFEKREGGPGQHGKGRQSFSDYKLQLRSKQKAKRMYCLDENTFRKLFDKAIKLEGVAGTNLLVYLERRLDNIVYRLGYAISRPQARQLVSHGLVYVNGKKLTIPSYSVALGDKISLAPKAMEFEIVKAALKGTESKLIPSWLSINQTEKCGEIVSYPTRDQLPPTIKEQLIVELYSR